MPAVLVTGLAVTHAELAASSPAVVVTNTLAHARDGQAELAYGAWLNTKTRQPSSQRNNFVVTPKTANPTTLC